LTPLLRCLSPHSLRRSDHPDPGCPPPHSTHHLPSTPHPRPSPPNAGGPVGGGHHKTRAPVRAVGSGDARLGQEGGHAQGRPGALRADAPEGARRGARRGAGAAAAGLEASQRAQGGRLEFGGPQGVCVCVLCVCVLVCACVCVVKPTTFITPLIHVDGLGHTTTPHRNRRPRSRHTRAERKRSPSRGAFSSASNACMPYCPSSRK
jgi:hypothetical protein